LKSQYEVIKQTAVYNTLEIYIQIFYHVEKHL